MTRIPELEQELVAAAARLQSPRRVLRPAARVALAAAAVAVVVALVVAGAVDRDDAGRGGVQTGRPPLPPAAKVAVDGEAGIRFKLNGRALTIRLLPYAPGETRDKVLGHRLRATCGESLAEPPGGSRQADTFRWPARLTYVHLVFPRDSSRFARWCRLEDPVVGHVAFVNFGGPRPGPMARIDQAANEWARFFAASDPAACGLMAQPACERMDCVRVPDEKIENCEPPSQALRKSFRGATVLEIAIDGKHAAARLSNGKTVSLLRTNNFLPGGAWSIDRYEGNPGSELFR